MGDSVISRLMGSPSYEGLESPANIGRPGISPNFYSSPSAGLVSLPSHDESEAVNLSQGAQPETKEINSVDDESANLVGAPKQMVVATISLVELHEIKNSFGERYITIDSLDSYNGCLNRTAPPEEPLHAVPDHLSATVLVLHFPSLPWSEILGWLPTSTDSILILLKIEYLGPNVTFRNTNRRWVENVVVLQKPY